MAGGGGGSTVRILASSQSPGAQPWSISGPQDRCSSRVTVFVPGMNVQLAHLSPVPSPFPWRSYVVCVQQTNANWVDTRNQEARFSSAPSSRIDPFSASWRF